MLLAVALIQSGLADTIQLRDGRSFSGRVVVRASDPQRVILVQDGIVQSFALEEIKSISAVPQPTPQPCPESVRAVAGLSPNDVSPKSKHGKALGRLAIDVLNRSNGGTPRPDLNAILGPTVSSLIDPNQQPITTRFTDARCSGILPEDFTPPSFAPLSALARTPDGAFLLRPGAFEGYVQSYCLRAGTYGPSRGTGYWPVPLTGPKAAMVQGILRQSVLHPEVPQQDIQVLLWAIIARTDYDHMPEPMQRTAKTLLTPEMVNNLRRGPLRFVPAGQRQQLEQLVQKQIAAIRGPLQQVFLAESNVRQQLASSASYQAIEGTAVLTGLVPPDPSVTPIPRAWVQDSQGFFVRYLPESYSKTKIQLFVPEAATTAANQPLVFDPANALATPANTGSQRLAITGREQDGSHPPCNDSTIQTSYSPQNPNYHRYPHAGESIRTILCEKTNSRCTKNAVFNIMLSSAQYIAPTDDTSPVTNCKITLVNINMLTDLLYYNPIRSVIGEYSVTNYTKPGDFSHFGHFLHPGKVVRTINENDTAVYVETWGEGTGNFGDLNEKRAPDVWHGVDNKLRDAVNQGIGSR
ncbi:MAG: hypothetical protein JST16_09060 [Bdellovibrionales bacterium]|nr:hypothetical protein [Bdellovibrionales bacterium]